jgi:hypothetical protein
MSMKPDYRSFTVQGATETYRRGTYGYDLMEFVEATIARAESAEAANRSLLRERVALTEDAAVDRASAAFMAYPRTRGITPHDEAMRAALRAALGVKAQCRIEGCEDMADTLDGTCYAHHGSGDPS